MNPELLLSIVLIQIGLHLLLQLGYSSYRAITGTETVARYGRDDEPGPAGRRPAWSRSIFDTVRRTPGGGSGSSHSSATGG